MNSQSAEAASQPVPEVSRPNPSQARREVGPTLTHGQRLLAIATAVAVLASGANAVAQLARLLLQR